jgi:two-component system sensor histidine kinase TctE
LVAWADVRACSDEVVGRLAPLAHKKKITLGYDGPAKPVPVAVDVLLAAEAVQNIVENALKHTPAGKTVVVNVKSGGVIEVIDQGSGIPDGEKNMIFSRFWQGEGRTEGSGLGLAIVAEIMRQHGGKVSVRDGEAGSKKQGSVFTLDFRPAS